MLMIRRLLARRRGDLAAIECGDHGSLGLESARTMASPRHQSPAGDRVALRSGAPLHGRGTVLRSALRGWLRRCVPALIERGIGGAFRLGSTAALSDAICVSRAMVPGCPQSDVFKTPDGLCRSRCANAACSSRCLHCFQHCACVFAPHEAAIAWGIVPRVLTSRHGERRLSAGRRAHSSTEVVK